MSIINKLDEKWQSVEACVDRLMSTGAYSNTAPEITALREELASIRSKRYTIAVCGDAKSGKSTFLNALIFGDSVLPTFDTPLTAKLTFIKHTDQSSHAEVVFLNETEWQDFLRDADASGNRERLSEMLHKCQAGGQSANKWIGHEPVTLDNPADIADYVCDPLNAERPGIYTPFVKSVSVYVNHAALKGLDIVDTPGLNDSNELNSTATQRWVREAHALIYILPTRGAAQSDVEFFKTYFPASAADARIFVQNKIDDFPTDYLSARRAIKDYGKREEFRRLNLFGANEVICSYSGLYELIRKKSAAGLMLNDEERWYEDKWENGDELNRLPSGFKGDPDGLEKVLAEKLFNKEGKVRISKAVGNIRSLYNRAIEKIVAEMEMARLRAQDCLQDVPALERKKARYEEFRNQITGMNDSFSKKQDDVIRNESEKLRRAFEAARENVLRDVRKTALDCSGHDSRIRDCVPATLRSSKRRHFGSLGESVDAIRKSMRSSLEELVDDIKRSASAIGIQERINVGMQVDYDAELESLVKNVAVDGDALYDQVPWKIRQFFTGDNAESIASKIEEMVAKILDANVDVSLSNIRNGLKSKYNDGVRDISVRLKHWLDQREADCADAVAKIDEAKENQTRFEAQVEACQAKIDALNEKLREYDEFVGGIGVCMTRQM